ncbi:MAG: DMT family transporter [Paracoccaceae bacterium]
MGKDNVWLAIALSLLALTLFDAMGLVIKLLSPRYSSAELTAWRNLFGLIPSTLALCFSSGWQRQGRPLRMRQWKLALTRGMIVVLAQLCFYTSLSVLAFATASALSYANALFMTALAVPLLGERVGAVRWSAVLVGFAGVVLIMQPGSDSFSIHALLPVGAALFYALMGVSARMIDEDVPTPLLNLYSNAASSVCAFVMALGFGGFTPLHNLTDLAWIAAMGGFGGVAVLCLVVAFRMTEQSNLAPFSYFGIPIAFVLGWIFFDEAPWSDLFPGALLIIVGGLLIVWRERGKAKP